MRTFTLLLLVVKQSAAFVPGKSGPASIHRGLSQARSASVQPRLSPLSGTRSGDSGTPLWRYELDDLIKAASPWGSFVEAEFIATDICRWFWERKRELEESPTIRI